MPQFLNNYNPITGYKLSTYLSRCVYLWAIKRVKMDQLVKVPVNNTKTSRNIGRFMYDIDDLDQNNMPIYRSDPLDQLIIQENVEQLKQAITKLSPRNQTLLCQVMDDNTFSAVGRQLGITRERVRQIYNRSLQVIKEILTNGNGD
jgi:RNA polymerase sigma factor (sigma-70 family)